MNAGGVALLRAESFECGFFRHGLALPGVARIHLGDRLHVTSVIGLPVAATCAS